MSDSTMSTDKMGDIAVLPDAIQWAEGMLLTPQHFQQNDIHWHAVLQQRLRALTPYAWGVRHVKIDMPLLATGLLAIVELECVFPDGMPYVFRSDASPLKLNLESFCKIDGKPVRVCLALPPRTGAMKVPSTSIKRFDPVQESTAVIDEMTGIADVFVDRMRPRVELFAEHEVPAGYSFITLIEVCRNERNAQIEATVFHPPMLRMGAASGLGGNGLLRSLQALRDQLWDKLHQLTGMAEGDVPERVSAMGPEERLQLNLARQIAAILPLFDAVILDAETSPMQAYQALAQAVGHMAWIGTNPAPLAMARYVHENCMPQFTAAMDFINRKLSLINTDWDSLAFARIGELIFARRLSEDVGKQLYIELRPRDGQNRRDIEAWLGNARIASEELMPVLRQRRLSGALWRMLGAQEVTALGLRSDAMICVIENQRIEVAEGLVDCFRAGRSLLIQGESVQGAPAAVLLHNRKSAAHSEASEPGKSGAVEAEAGPAHA